MTRLLFVAYCLLISACVGPSTQQQTYPAEITGIGESPNFPLSAAGYKRGKLLMYAPGMTDHSIGYDLYEPSLQNAVTLYFYPGSADLTTQFEAEKRQILGAHPGAVLLSDSSATFEKNGKKFPARVATFRFDGTLAQSQQTVFSEIILIPLRTRYFKVRSTAPFAQAVSAEVKARELMGVVNWAP